MGKFKIGLQIDVTFLQQLIKEKTSGVSVQKSRHHVVMHPLHLKNFNGSVKDLLNLGIAKFDKNLGGILLGYQNIKLINEKGVIHNDSSGIHVDLEGDFFVFKPGVGREMKGIVNRKGRDFLGVLVYNTFNVSIPKPHNENNWLGHEVQIGYEVLFQIQDVDTSLHLPYIRGELISVVSKPEGIEQNIQNTPLKKKKSSKILFDDTDASVEDETSVSENITEGIKKQKLKIKKRKLKQEFEEIEENNQETIQSSPKKSKKKKAAESTREEQRYVFSEINRKKSKKQKKNDIPS